jgi:hypothetical protein
LLVGRHLAPPVEGEAKVGTIRGLAHQWLSHYLVSEFYFVGFDPRNLTPNKRFGKRPGTPH